ncbi:hypothetical protein VTL71DRAFT_13190 [Oculimacula yallundae]|uniref:Endo-1,3(4)-beta-glucanase 1 carbohydrate binding domain-containing protein n=1 Tax=Oculimacula yallundae TaxID=86028 RepID=A0ABR4CJM2_9HELO
MHGAALTCFASFYLLEPLYQYLPRRIKNMVRKVGLLLLGVFTYVAGGQSIIDLKACGDAFYSPSMYTCYDSDFLCPILDGRPTIRCGPDCYLPEMYSCSNGRLIFPPSSSSPASGTATSSGSPPGATCSTEATTLELDSLPYRNYFYSDCHSASQVVVTSPEPNSNLTVIGPRIIVAWPGGNSGIIVYFEPEDGVNGTLGITLVNSSSSFPLSPVYDASGEGNATVGISTQVQFNTSVVLSVAILGSIRTIRDFVEGPSLLRDEIQSALNYSNIENGVEISRLWLDNITTTTISLSSREQSIQLDNTTVTLAAGTYTFNATYDYPQLTSLSAMEVLSPGAEDLITQSPDQTTSLSFLSYTTKLTAGAWRFLTYFGRDSMIAALLLEPVLSAGEGGALEAVIAGVLERVNMTDGSVCHEETIGDYATWLNMQNNITSTAPLCDYKMIDTDYFLPVLMEHYFLRNTEGSTRASDFLGTSASILSENSELTYRNLAQISAQKIVTTSAPFATLGNQTIANLIHLKQNEIVGEWRDSTYGIGGGKIPFDVNTALVPAALRSISKLTRAGILDFNATLVDEYAQVWEDSTLAFFEISVTAETARERVEGYASTSETEGLVSHSSSIDSDVVFYGLALDGNNNLSNIAVMNTDTCFHLFMLNTTNQTQLTTLINATANSIIRRFPAGLMTDVGMLVANPAYGDNPIYAANWTTNAYHGTVVWSWQLAMMAKGLELQLARCKSPSIPDFCSDESVYENLRMAYNELWDVIDANAENLSTEVWSWTYDSENDRFEYIDLGGLPPPAGAYSARAHYMKVHCDDVRWKEIYSIVLIFTRNQYKTQQ